MEQGVPSGHSFLRETLGTFRRGVLGRRLLIAILLFSSAVTFVLTLFDLFVDYRGSVDDLQRRLDTVENSYGLSLGEGLWNLDKRQVELQAEAISRMPDVQLVDVREDAPSGSVPLSVTIGKSWGEASIVRDIPLSCNCGGGVRRIGTLHVEADLSGIYHRLVGRTLIILANSAIKTFLVATFILFTVHHLVTRHLVGIARAVSCCTSAADAPVLRLNRERGRRPDELDNVVDAINGMSANLARQQTDLAASNDALVQHVTALRQAEDSLRASVDALGRSNAELERFAYIASHDLQEPARTLVAYSQLVERRYARSIDEDGREFLQYIVGAALRMQKMVQGLLAYSEIGRRDRPLAPTSMAAVVASAFDTLRSELAGVEMQVELDPPELPVVLGDEPQLVMLAAHLLSNAVAFRKPDMPLSIRISAQRGPDGWMFAFADNGLGVEAQYWDDIFLIFKSFHPHGGQSGIGVGLALCKRIIERHGGRIWLSSQAGIGATFHFTLPYCEAKAD